jgi:hypothetical protein
LKTELSRKDKDEDREINAFLPCSHRKSVFEVKKFLATIRNEPKDPAVLWPVDQLTRNPVSFDQFFVIPSAKSRKVS